VETVEIRSSSYHWISRTRLFKYFCWAFLNLIFYTNSAHELVRNFSIFLFWTKVPKGLAGMAGRAESRLVLAPSGLLPRRCHGRGCEANARSGCWGESAIGWRYAGSSSRHSAEEILSSDFGVSTSLISQGYWEQSKWYFVNVERGNIADKLQPRNINVSFNNNSNVPIDVIIFTFYSDQLTIDVETGIITK